MNNYEFVFTAIKGLQAGRPYYVAMCPMKLVPKLFHFSDSEIPAKLRAQRVLNKSRIPEMVNYMIDNKKNYIFSSLTVSIGGDVIFEKFSIDNVEQENIGQIRIPMDSTLLINDGQHRRAAIEKALEESPELGDETISVVFFLDVGLKKSQQMFADLNKHAVRPTRSLGVLYDHREPLSVLAKKVVNEHPVFLALTEVEKTSISNRSTKLFTLSGIYEGTRVLLRKSRKTKKITKKEENLAIEFWGEVINNMKDWNLAYKKEVSTSELRKNYIHAHGLALQVIGKLGAELIEKENENYKKLLKKLDKIDWSR